MVNILNYLKLKLSKMDLIVYTWFVCDCGRRLVYMLKCWNIYWMLCLPNRKNIIHSHRAHSVHTIEKPWLFTELKTHNICMCLEDNSIDIQSCYVHDFEKRIRKYEYVLMVFSKIWQNIFIRTPIFVRAKAGQKANDAMFFGDKITNLYLKWVAE